MLLRFSHRSLASQIAIVFGALTTALAVLLSVAFTEMLRGGIHDNAALALDQVATSVARQLEDQLAKRSRQVTQLAQSQPVWAQGIDAAPVRQLFARVQNFSPENLWIGIADPQGIVRASTGDLLRGQSVKERPWFGAGLQGPYVGDVHPAKLLSALLPVPSSGEPLRFVDFAAPVTIDGKLAGVMGIHASWQWANELIDMALPANARTTGLSVYIFDRQGGLIYAPDDQTLRLRDGGFTMPAGVSDAGGATHVVRWADGRDYLSARAAVKSTMPVTDLGWQVVAREPAEVAESRLRRTTLIALALGIAAAAVASLLAYRASRGLSHNLHEIAVAARRVEKGAPDAAIPDLGGSQEVAALSSTLGSMTRQLLGANQRMEEEVRERTRELVAANAELDRQARSDPLTGLLNRRGFEERMQLALAASQRSGRPLAVAMLDADHFKRVNDRFGHDVGDVVLRFLARTLADRVRTTDATARLGGEEFVALLPDTGLEGAQVMAEGLREAIAAHEDPVYGRITVSIGVAVAAGEEADATDLLHRADEALYRAKHEGRNRVCAAADAGTATPPPGGAGGWK